MDKIRNINNYIETVKENSDFFQRYYYHSVIDLNFMKVDTILQNGILCKKLIEEHKLPSLYTHCSKDFDSKNGDDYVSLSEYNETTEFVPMFESFSMHTLTSLSFMVTKEIPVQSEGARPTYFDDEVFCFHEIPTTYLTGIIFPEHLSSLLIKVVNCLPNDISCYTKTYLNQWISCVQQYFHTSLSKEDIQKIKESYTTLWDIIAKYEQPSTSAQDAIRTQRSLYGQDLKDVLASILHRLWALKYQIENPTFMDILMKVNQNQLPIYEIQENTLKRMI